MLPVAYGKVVPQVTTTRAGGARDVAEVAPRPFSPGDRRFRPF